MVKSKKQQNDDDINYKKLFFELMSVLTVIFVIVIVITISFLINHGVFDADNRYAAFDEILDVVDHYDGSKGRDLELEKRLDENYYADNLDTAKTFYYGIASATYYCEIGYYTTSEQIFNILYMNVPEGKRPRDDLETRDVICKRKMEKRGV